MTDANHPRMSLRKMATILGVSQPFLSQIRAGKRPMPEALRTKVEALGAYHLLITDKQSGTTPATAEGGKIEKIGSSDTTKNGGQCRTRTCGLLRVKQAL